MAAEIRITVVSQASGTAAQQAVKDIEGLGKAAKDAGSGFSSFGEIAKGALREIGSAGIGIALDGFKALGGAIMDGIADAREAAKINAQTAAVIKSTGGAAGVSAEHVQDYAAALSAASGKSLFGDSQIQESENLLLTFTEIKGATLDAATAMTVDLAQAMGTAPKDAAIQLGKALNDPVKGITALSRVGVTFSEDQKAMIQSLVDTGDVAGAQAVILAELNKEFGGSAEAAAKADGGWAQLQDRWGEAKETIGAALLPLLGTLVGVLNDQIMPAVESAAAAFSAWLNDPATKAGIAAITTGIQALLPVVAAAVAAFTAAGPGIAPFGVALNDLAGIWEHLQALINVIAPAIQAVVTAVFGQIQIFIQAHGAEISAFMQQTWTQIAEIIHLALDLIQATIVPALQAIAAYIQAHGEEIQTILGAVWTIISSIISAALELIKGVITVALDIIKGNWSGAWTAIQTMSANFVLAILNVIRGFLTIAETLFSGAWEKIKSDLAIDFQIITMLFHTAWDGIKAYFQGIMDGLTGWVVQTFEAIKNAIVGTAGKLRSAAGGVGDAIIQGMVDGIESGVGAIISAAKAAAQAALDAAMSIFDSHSPSKAFAQIGFSGAQGMALGLAGGAPMVAGAGAYMASAAMDGASRTYNQQRSVNVTQVYHGVPAAPAMDTSTAMALAGV